MTSFLVTGATGFIGARFAELALARGDRVHTFTRGNWSESPAVPVANRFFGTFPNDIPSAALQGAEAVVHCAAVTESVEAAAHAVNVTGTLRLAQMAAEAGARSFIFLSSQNARADAISVYGRSKFAAEEELRKLTGLDVVILRPGLVCGPGSRGLFQRMCGMVEKLPLIPLLGGGRSIVQPIHVDDLCAAIFAASARSREFAGAVLHLGDPEGLSLADLLQHIAEARGGRKRMLSIPLWPVELAVATAEAVHLPLPINSNNLKGLKTVEKMETAADLGRLGVALRPLPDLVAPKSASAPRESLPLGERAVRVILIGAGRIGLVHALTLSRQTGIDFVGIVDPKKGALGMLRGMGLKTRAFDSLDEALREARPDAALIATPASTHLPLARQCLEKGVRVLVEKPLAVRPAQLDEFRKLAAEFPQLSIQVGYVMPRNPQVETMLARLRAGEFGRVLGFTALTLHAYILHHDPKRWETQKAISGGGVLINSGGHVLSMIHAAFGRPREVEAQTLRIHSTEVEDSMVLRFDYGDFSGTHCASWSIHGFQRQENRLIVATERGTLILTASSGVFLPLDGPADICHQLDFEVGFNLAPDYAGAGFTREVNDLANSVRTSQDAPMNLGEAAQVEELLFEACDKAESTESFQKYASAVETFGKVTVSRDEAALSAEAKPIRRVLDLRELSRPTVDRYLAGANEGWDGYGVTSSHLSGAAWENTLSRRLRVTVPDFLQQSRLLMSGRYVQVVQRMGVSGVFRAGLAALPEAVGARAVSFWAAALGLLAGDLVRIPRSFDGTLLLHGYLTDLALALQKTSVLEKMLKMCRQAAPAARIGFHTNLADSAHAMLPVLSSAVDEISALSSPRGARLDEIFHSLSRVVGGITAEVGPAPAAVHQLAARRPHDWTHGAGAILLGPTADATLAAGLRAEKEAAWTAAFPGLPMLDAAL